MKKLLSILLTTIILLSLFSCSSKKEIIINYDNVEKQKEPPKLNVMYGKDDIDAGITLDENTRFIDIIHSTPSLEGYVFAGWYSDSAFTDYINPTAITKAQYTRGYAYAKWIKSDPITYNVRSDVATITDTGRDKQTMDVVRMSSDFNPVDLKRAGFSKICVTVQLDITEVDDGYQHVFLYKDSKCVPTSTSSLVDLFDKYVIGSTDPQDPSLLFAKQLEHGPGKQDTSTKTYTFEVEIDVTLLSDDLYIRYGASGNKEDTWRNQNIIVTILPIK